MYKVFILALPLFFFSTASYSQKDSIEATIISFFDGLSELNPDKLKAYTTDEFLLLENGEVWNIDTLISKMTPLKGRNIKRVNRFVFITTEQKGDFAWITYHNDADFSLNDRRQTISWLESAVLIKQSGRWKIKMLHSTKKS